MSTNIRVIAYYLPQFHPIPENDQWWGKGFTEWTNVAKAKPLFRGHYQPRLPGDLGFYDLRVPETRMAQAELAKNNGIEGFCYWHYWFGDGRQLLERPFNEVLRSGEPDFPFCLAWANESWKGFNHGLGGRNVLIEQHYFGDEDYMSHFYSLLPAFHDKRYIRIDGKPLFIIYKPKATPEIKRFIEIWRNLSYENGLNGIYFVGHSNDLNVSYEEIFDTGVDAINTVRLGFPITNIKRASIFLNRIFRNRPITISYNKMFNYFIDPVIDSKENVFPSIVPGWDHTPRSGLRGLVYKNATPELFHEHVQMVLELLKKKRDDRKIVFIKSWNEWAEGNYMEPDSKYGDSYLLALRECLKISN